VSMRRWILGARDDIKRIPVALEVKIERLGIMRNHRADVEEQSSSGRKEKGSTALLGKLVDQNFELIKCQLWPHATSHLRPGHLSCPLCESEALKYLNLIIHSKQIHQYQWPIIEDKNFNFMIMNCTHSLLLFLSNNHTHAYTHGVPYTP
jgi:hypothetical protein